VGAYVNVVGEDKEVWLRREGKVVSRSIKFEDIPADSLLVVVVDNMLFTAAGICFSKGEFDAFTDPSDDRRKVYYVVSKEKLYANSNLESYLPKGK
jgi:hypothetical protein